MKKQIVLLTVVTLLLSACAVFAQGESATPLPNVAPSPTLPPIIELPAVPNHVDVLGVWNVIEVNQGSFAHKFEFLKYEFTESILIEDNLVAVRYEWLDANRQVWWDTPLSTSLAAARIHVIVSVSREGNILTLTLGDGYIKLQQ